MLQRPTAARRCSWHSRFLRPKLISAPKSSCGEASIYSHRPPTRSLDIARCSSAIRTEICWRCLRIFSPERPNGQDSLALCLFHRAPNDDLPAARIHESTKFGKLLLLTLERLLK